MNPKPETENRKPAVAGRILVITQSKGSLLETLPVTRLLRSAHGLEPVYFIESKRADAAAEVLAEERMRALAPTGEPFQPERAAEAKAPGEKKRDGLRQRLYRLAPESFRLVRHYRALVRQARAILDRLPDLRALLLVGDRHVGYETALVRAANERGIPSLIVPFASSFPEAAAEPRMREESFSEKYEVTGRWRTRVAERHPRWVFEHKGRRMFFRPPADCLAAHRSGIMPENPWTLGGGAATRMTVDSEESRAMFLRQGMDGSKMVVTGRPSMDDVARTLRDVDASVIRRELGVPDGKKVVLCSVPQLAEHDLLPWDRHWKEIDFLFETMAGSGAAVVLSLHPKSDPAQYRPRAERFGAIVAARRVYELLPACDVFVASYSSIVAPAIALKKPSVVVDFYDLGYPPYDAAPGTTVVREREKLGPILKRLLEEPAFYAEQAEAQKKDGHRWAMLDGGCTRRVVEEMLRLVAGAAGVR